MGLLESLGLAGMGEGALKSYLTTHLKNLEKEGVKTILVYMKKDEDGNDVADFKLLKINPLEMAHLLNDKCLSLEKELKQIEDGNRRTKNQN